MPEARPPELWTNSRRPSSSARDMGRRFEPMTSFMEAPVVRGSAKGLALRAGSSEEHSSSLGGERLHVLNQDVLGSPVVKNQSEDSPADHAADARRLEIAGPD